MTIQSKAANKAAFQTGDRPEQADFVNLIDSYQDRTSALDQLASARPGLIEVTASAPDLGVSAVPVGAFGRSIIGVGATASGRNLLGAGTLGAEIFQAATTASAQSHLGAGAAGIAVLEAETTASAASIVGGTDEATTAQAAGGVDTTVFLSPQKAQYSPFGMRGRVTFTSAGTVTDSERVSSVTKVSAGDFLIKWSRAMPTSEYTMGGLSGVAGAQLPLTLGGLEQTVSSMSIRLIDRNGNSVDPNNLSRIGLAVFCSGV